jgi:serine O-acetyltransferase
MEWLADFRRDLEKYADPRTGAAWKALLLEQGLWVTFQYRIEAAVYRSRLPRFIKAPLRIVLTVWHKFVEVLTGVCLPCTARIGPGLHLPHCGSRIVNSTAVIGADCCLCPGVGIGISGHGVRRGVPVVGDRVYFGVNAVAVGSIRIGDDVCIGANSLVNRNVPSHCTVIGVPAAVVSDRGSEDFIATRNFRAGMETLNIER